MNNTTILGLLLLYSVLTTSVIVITYYWNPYAFRVAWAKRIVWLVQIDGSLEPVSAKIEGLAYKTKDHGLFEFEKVDSVNYCKKPGVLAFAPYSKVLRPEMLPVLQSLKRIGVQRYDQLMAILRATTMTEAEYNEALEKEKEATAPVKAKTLAEDV